MAFIKRNKGLTAKRLNLAGYFVALAIAVACSASDGEIPLDAALKTGIPADPYGKDGVSFRVLCYHDARDNLLDTFQSWPERGALDTVTLIEQFEWLRENGYHMVSLDQILAARNGGPKLPAKAMLLTFDDGYLSVYTRIFPLLKLFNYPAVIGLVGEWLTGNHQGNVFYGDRWIPRRHFVTWPQVREMMASGLIEVASHSHSLHKGAISNPQGSLPSSAITRIYTPQTKRYENDAEYIARIRSDLAKNSALIVQETGKKPRVMIWPYGAYNMLAVQAAEAENMPITMTLEPGANTPAHPLNRIRRDMLFFHDKVSDLKRNLRQQDRYDGEDQPLTRIVAIDLDTLYDPDPSKQDKKLGEFIERIKQLRVNTVYLHAVTDLDRDGYADAAYFPNRHLPMRADLFNRTAWQLRTRASVEPETLYVYAWLPALAFESVDGKPASRSMVKEIYDDAGKNAPRIGGLLFDNDEPLNALSNSDLIQFTHDLITIFKVHQPYAFTARLVSAASVFNTEPGTGSRISLTNLLKHYDFVALSLPPAIESNTAIADLAVLMDKVRQIPGALNTTAFIVPATTEKSLISSTQIADQLALIQQYGARNFGYYPDQAISDHPAVVAMKPKISLQTNPGH